MLKPKGLFSRNLDYYVAMKKIREEVEKRAEKREQSEIATQLERNETLNLPDATRQIREYFLELSSRAEVDKNEKLTLRDAEMFRAMFTYLQNTCLPVSSYSRMETSRDMMVSQVEWGLRQIRNSTDEILIHRSELKRLESEIEELKSKIAKMEDRRKKEKWKNASRRRS